MNKWLFLSYELSPELSAYGNGQRAAIEADKSIPGGDSCSTSFLTFSSHLGTHIDFPKHFSDNGAAGGDYSAGDFVFSNVRLIDIPHKNTRDYLITPDLIPVEKLEPSTDLLLIKTGLGEQRFSDIYWEKYPGLAPQLAALFKDKMPGLRAVGFDLISISSWQRRDIGRIAHREFLVNDNILIIEDMDLSKVEASTCFKQVIVSPLRFKNADGSPVTVFAEVQHES